MKASINETAALDGRSMPWNPLQGNMIAPIVDKRASTISILYGNDAAVAYARSHSIPEYPDGSVLALVTWEEQADVRWFGGQIPGRVKSIEFVTQREGRATYERFEGVPLTRTATSGESRAAELLSIRAPVTVN